nr:invasion associated locus B family protein [Aestuariivirga litoralis]
MQFRAAISPSINSLGNQTVNVRKTLLLAGLLAALAATSSTGFAQTDQTQGQTQEQPKSDAGGNTQGQSPPPPANLGPRAGGQQAAGGAPQGPPVETIATHNGWIVQCGDVPAQKDQPPQKACGMTRTGNNTDEQKIGLTLIVKRQKDQTGKASTTMDAWAPIGVYLPTGVAMEIDGTALEGRLAFTRCLPQGVCIAFGEASEATLKKFAKGKQITFYLYDRPGHGFPVKFPLPGFVDGLADLDKNAPTPPKQ